MKTFLTITTAAAALAIASTAANAQFLLGENLQGQKQVQNLWAGQPMAGAQAVERRAARIPHSAEQGLLLAEDPYTGEKVVINRRAGESASGLRIGGGTFRGRGESPYPRGTFLLFERGKQHMIAPKEYLDEHPR